MKKKEQKQATPPKTTHMSTITKEEPNPPTLNICNDDSLAPTTICTDYPNDVFLST